MRGVSLRELFPCLEPLSFVHNRDPFALLCSTRRREIVIDPQIRSRQKRGLILSSDRRLPAMEFLGSNVRLYLASGVVVDGRVANIDQDTQLLTLQNVSATINGSTHHYPSYPVSGHDIKDLQIVTAVDAQARRPPEPPQPPAPAGPPLPQPRYQEAPLPPQYPVPGQHPGHHPHQHFHHPHQHVPAPHGPPGPPAFPYAAQPEPFHQHQPPPHQFHSQAQPQHVSSHAPPSHVHKVESEQGPQARPKPTTLFQDPAIISMSPSPSKSQYPTKILSRGANTPKQSSGLARTPPVMAKTPSGGSSVERRSQTPKAARHTGGQNHAAHAITVTESELDGEVDFSDLNGTSANESPMQSRTNGNSRRRVADGRRSNSRGGRESQGRRDGQSPNGGKLRKGRREETFKEDVANLSDDFDFQAGLTQFDKRREFEKIREADETDPETLLVSHNRLRPVPQGMQKMGIRQMVLDSSVAPSGEETGNEAEVESASDSEEAVALAGLPEEAPPLVEFGGSRRRICQTLGGVAVPAVTPGEMLEIERIAGTETGPSDEQMIENGGRGCAMMILQALGGNRRIKPGNHNDGPLVVVLTGNNKIGAFGLCAARHLANHECNVIVSAVGTEAEMVNSVAAQHKTYVFSGGKLAKGMVDLPHPASQPVDLIVDALLGTHQSILDLSEHDRSLVCQLFQYANENKANVLSLDFASGVHGTTGVPMSPLHHIKPKWTLALGLPKIGHLRADREVVGELFLADLGIPRVVFQKVNLSKSQGNNKFRWIPPFGDKFLVGLEIADV
ncbi:YjeF N-terminal domain-containing protein [Fimicolochytrium jonesii]|uniref:YjeF N-terminal domain-containing protein n=1 Tax=Fimicolochytrium jonesii TaxID=1396493 RepID=UPI0022FF04D2|nr:YjeF N-terminal domain-containing protein [Fimicolochytrium jonesii]KAI8826915.1 YjeF N-terminal domain-containing protein [Fimicolochytrium jonesii]